MLQIFITEVGEEYLRNFRMSYGCLSSMQFSFYRRNYVKTKWHHKKEVFLKYNLKSHVEIKCLNLELWKMQL